MRGSLLALAVIVPVSVAWSGPTMGRFNILTEAHGYSSKGKVVLPLRPVGQWLGAEVDYKDGTVSLRDGSRSVDLKVGGTTASVNGKMVKLAVPARVYGGITCVPLRSVAEALGCEVEYISAHQGGSLTMNRHAVLTRHGATARVLVHGVTPDHVSELVAAVARVHGAYGTDWIADVVYFRDGFWFALIFGWIGSDGNWDQDMWNQFYYSEESACVWGRRNGKLELVLSGLYERSDMVAAGMPAALSDDFIAHGACPE